MSKKDNVTAAKPKVGGAMYVAPAGTALPTDATTALAEAFKSLGYISEDGLTNSNSPESEEIKAWGGDIVLTPITGRPDTYSVKLIESLNVDVLKMAYGDDNVTGTLETGITVKANATDLEEHPVVVDMILRNGVLKRICIPSAKVSEIGEISYTDADASGYELTLSCQPDADGNTHYEYIKEATA
nr:MAG TPA: tail protein [Caudoviricetes sp.]